MNAYNSARRIGIVNLWGSVSFRVPSENVLCLRNAKRRRVIIIPSIRQMERHDNGHHDENADISYSPTSLYCGYSAWVCCLVAAIYTGTCQVVVVVVVTAAVELAVARNGCQ
jgi:hypothetical protein